jgi:hypothetical protein
VWYNGSLLVSGGGGGGTTSNVPLIASNIVANGASNNYLWDVVQGFSNTFIGTSAANGSNVFIGNQGAGRVNLQGNVWYNGSALSSGTNIGTGAASNNTVILGTLGQTTTTLNGGSLVLTNYGPTILTTSTIASGGPARVLGIPMVMTMALSTDTGTVYASTTPVTWLRNPMPWTLYGVRAHLYTPGTTATSVDIRFVPSATQIPTNSSAGTSLFSTLLTVAANKQSSCETGNTPMVLGTTTFADDTGFAFFVNPGSGAAGLKLSLYYYVY